MHSVCAARFRETCALVMCRQGKISQFPLVYLAVLIKTKSEGEKTTIDKKPP